MLHTKIVDVKKEKILSSNAEKFIQNSNFGDGETSRRRPTKPVDDAHTRR